jgi:tyrosyl-tRNA synthetase
VVVPRTVLDELEARGLIHDSTDRQALAQRLASGPITLYYGCDPTRDSLHHGNLIGLVVLRRFQQAGHRVVALAGGATGMVGDPSGRSEERNLLDEATLDRNVAAIKTQIGRIVDLDGQSAVLVDNRDWTGDLRLLDFLRQVGKHATVNQMVARESVRVRMASEQGISFTEFSYMLLQANDYLWLHDHHGVELQIGGSDQWGNIVSGVDLIRRVRGHTVHALCWPLLAATDGVKLGKTTGAQVWLDPDKTSPYRFFQYWMQAEDSEVRFLLGMFTLLSLAEIDEVMADHDRALQQRHAQRTLAREVTTLVHGDAAAHAAEQASHVLFGGAVEDVGPEAFELLVREVPSARLPGNIASADGVDVLDLLVDSGLATSRSEARRNIDSGAVYVNGERLSAQRDICGDDLRHGRYVLVRKGKKNYAVGVVDDRQTTIARSG